MIFICEIDFSLKNNGLTRFKTKLCINKQLVLQNVLKKT